MKTLRTFVALLALAAIATFSAPAEFVPSLFAQATTTQTTLSAAVTTSDRVITVASATGFAAGRYVVVDGEAMVVASTYVSGTTIPVQRGYQTGVTPHASGAVVLAGPANYFAKNDPVGPCTATDQIALPLVVIPSHGAMPGNISVYNCQGATATTQRWQLYTKDGFPAAPFASIGGTQAGATPPSYAADGAITLLPGVSLLSKGSAGAYTLASPALYQNGMVMVIAASTAFAHTVTYTPGFFGTTTASDVCTITGAVGDNLVIYAQNGAWRILSTRNCTPA